MSILLPICLGCAMLGAAFGSPKDRSVNGFLLGLLWGPVGLIVLYYLPRKRDAASGRGKFYVDVVAKVDGRGMVLRGNAVEGEVTSGMRVVMPNWNKELVIRSVEAIRGPGISVDSLELVLGENASGMPRELVCLTEGKTLDREH